MSLHYLGKHEHEPRKLCVCVYVCQSVCLFVQKLKKTTDQKLVH